MALSSFTRGYLHIGLPKTGTTAIQNALFKQRDVLASRCRVLYPSVEANHTTPLCTMFLDDPMQHVANKMSLTAASGLADVVEGYFRAFESEIASSTCESLLFSAEGLSNLAHQEIAKLKGWLTQFTHDWTVLVWVRHPVALTRSVTQQLLKGGYHLDQLDQDPMLPNFKGKLKSWIDVFNHGNLIVRTYEEDVAAPGGVLRAFTKLAGIDEATSGIIESLLKWENESLSYEAAYILSSLNRQRPLFVESGLNYRRTGLELQLIEKVPGQKFDLPASMRQKVKVASRRDVEWLNETFNMNAYHDVFDDELDGDDSRTRGTLWSQQTVDAVAIALSDMMNSNFFHAEMAKGNQALQAGNTDIAIKHFQNAQRVCPEREAAAKQIEACHRVAARRGLTGG